MMFMSHQLGATGDWSCSGTTCRAQNAATQATLDRLVNLINSGLKQIGDSALLAKSDTIGPGTFQAVAKLVKSALPRIPASDANLEKYKFIAALADDPSRIDLEMVGELGEADMYGFIERVITFLPQKNQLKWWLIGGAGAVALGGVTFALVRKRR